MHIWMKNKRGQFQIFLINFTCSTTRFFVSIYITEPNLVWNTETIEYKSSLELPFITRSKHWNAHPPDHHVLLQETTFVTTSKTNIPTTLNANIKLFLSSFAGSRQASTWSIKIPSNWAHQIYQLKTVSCFLLCTNYPGNWKNWKHKE
jgi:hypothetical protein